MGQGEMGAKRQDKSEVWTIICGYIFPKQEQSLTNKNSNCQSRKLFPTPSPHSIRFNDMRYPKINIHIRKAAYRHNNLDFDL
uniref:Uncharacterized protein n=1 Tax=Romanomermis culicivorax TaxID=13658 RepID=A0A915HGA9_ROMCU